MIFWDHEIEKDEAMPKALREVGKNWSETSCCVEFSLSTSNLS